MPYIAFDHRKYILKTIRLKCLYCGDICETSKPYPDMAGCGCGKVSVDGGISMGATVNGDPMMMEDLSIFRTEVKPKLLLPQAIVTRHHEKIQKMCQDQLAKYEPKTD